MGALAASCSPVAVAVAVAVAVVVAAPWLRRDPRQAVPWLRARTGTWEPKALSGPLSQCPEAPQRAPPWSAAKHLPHRPRTPSALRQGPGNRGLKGQSVSCFLERCGCRRLSDMKRKRKQEIAEFAIRWPSSAPGRSAGYRRFESRGQCRRHCDGVNDGSQDKRPAPRNAAAMQRNCEKLQPGKAPDAVACSWEFARRRPAQARSVGEPARQKKAPMPLPTPPAARLAD